HISRRKRGNGRLLVPADPLEVVAHELLVEARLSASGLVLRLWPEARRVGREDFVDQDQLATRHTKLELGIGDDDALSFRVGYRATVNLERQVAQPRDEIAADDLAGLRLADVFVVARLRLGGR